MPTRARTRLGLLALAAMVLFRREATTAANLDFSLYPGRLSRRCTILAPGMVVTGASACAKAVEVSRPDGFRYETLQAGTDGTTLRDGPPKYAARVWIRFTGHVDSFDGEIFDSSKLRGARKPAQKDYVEITAGLEPTFAQGMWDALKLMKVGEKGRFVQPPALSFGEGKQAIEGDEDSKVKNIPPNSTLYYEVELVKIIRP
eukprot:TRINITY_DN35092_c0_g1_i1.p1 TRINITY_DN35092_c0_g1~~TRINITY_DN35092_c0_g1_i1.p1  ORF type:complete len:202 (-),score=36.00 TRINITY_DN35092_c0_g1_i1:8-613(-)